MLTYFCCTIEKFSPCFLLYDSLSEVFKKTYNASCSQLDRGTGCGGNHCWSAEFFLFLLSSAKSRISPLHIPRSSLGMTKKKKSWGMTKKKKSWGMTKKKKKRGMTIRRGEPAMTGGRESTNTAGEKTSPGCVKEAERSARRRGCLV